MPEPRGGAASLRHPNPLATFGARCRTERRAATSPSPKGSPQRRFGLSQTTRGSGSSQKTFFMRIQFVAGERAALHTARDKMPSASVPSLKTIAVEASPSLANAKTTAVEASPSLETPKRRP